MPVRILFQDEGRFGRISDRRRCWAPLPCRPVVGSQVVREYVYAMTAVSPMDGRLISLVMPWVDSQTMSIFLEHTAKTFPDDFCVMILDGAGYHRANDLKVPEKIALVFQPPYSPELNPVEHIWTYLRDNTFKNTNYGSLDEVVDVLAQGLKQLHQQPDIVRSMTCFDWINTIPLLSN